MAQLTIRLPDQLKRKMAKFRELNWSEVIRNAIEARILHEQTNIPRDRRRMLQAVRRQDEIAEALASRYKGRWDGTEVIRYWREHRYSSSTPR